jgi:hypothetical protein
VAALAGRYAARGAALTLNEARAELGVTRASAPADVRRAFKRLALELHPDRQRGQRDTTERFRRVLLAYEILSGQRAPAPEGYAPPGTASSRARRATREHMPWDPPSVEAMPIEAADGQPLHYPTPEEIRKLDIDDPGDPRKMMRRLFIGFLGLVALWWLMALLDPRPPPAPDPLRERQRRALGRPW